MKMPRLTTFGLPFLAGLKGIITPPRDKQTQQPVGRTLSGGLTETAAPPAALRTRTSTGSAAPRNGKVSHGGHSTDEATTAITTSVIGRTPTSPAQPAVRATPAPEQSDRTTEPSGLPGPPLVRPTSSSDTPVLRRSIEESTAGISAGALARGDRQGGSDPRWAPRQGTVSTVRAPRPGAQRPAPETVQGGGVAATVEGVEGGSNASGVPPVELSIGETHSAVVSGEVRGSEPAPAAPALHTRTASDVFGSSDAILRNFEGRSGENIAGDAIDVSRALRAHDARDESSTAPHESTSASAPTETTSSILGQGIRNELTQAVMVDAATQWAIELPGTAPATQASAGGPSGTAYETAEPASPHPPFRSDTIVYAGRVMNLFDGIPGPVLLNQMVAEVQDMLRAGLDPNSRRGDETLVDLAYNARGRWSPQFFIAREMADPTNPLDEIIHVIIGHPNFDLTQVRRPELRAMLRALVPQAQFARAARARDEARMTQLLDAGLDPNLVLPRAVKEDAAEAVLLLVDRGASSSAVPVRLFAQFNSRYTRSRLQALLSEPLFGQGALSNMQDAQFEEHLAALVSEAGAAAPNNPSEAMEMNMALLLRHFQVSVSDVDLAEAQLPRVVQNLDALVSGHRPVLSQRQLRLAVRMLGTMLPDDIKSNPDIAATLANLGALFGSDVPPQRSSQQLELEGLQALAQQRLENLRQRLEAAQRGELRPSSRLRVIPEVPQDESGIGRP